MLNKNAWIKDQKSSTKNIYKISAKTIVNFCGRPDVGTWACALCIPLRPGPSIFLGYLYANKHIKQTPKMDKFSPQICNSISMEIRYFFTVGWGASSGVIRNARARARHRLSWSVIRGFLRMCYAYFVKSAYMKKKRNLYSSFKKV